jgi:hypothetical protein
VTRGLAQIQPVGLKRAVALAIAGAAVLAGAFAVPAGDAAQSGATPSEVVSPLPGTPDANPATQISFLGAPASRLRRIVVTGSRSGPDPGRLHYYSTHTGGSFLPSHPFLPGERVTVSATILGYGTPIRVGTSFTVSSPYALPAPAPTTAVAGTAADLLQFHSRHDLEPPVVTVTTPASDPALGDVFVSPDSGPAQTGPMIVTPSGTLVWFDPLAAGMAGYDLNVQSYQGQPALTWWQGQVVEGHGQGVDVIENDRYAPVATVHAGNGLYADLHDFQITPQGTAWITAFAPQHFDLSRYGGNRHGLIDDGVIQEIDIKTGLVMFQWDALGHVAVADTHMRTPQIASNVLDYFHVNSIDALANGDLLISSRNTWTVFLISEKTGAVIWRLGGKQSSFSLGAGVRFAWQHDAELRPDGTISVFDNEAAPAESPQSRVLDIALNRTTDTATLASQLTYPGRGILSDSQGDVQLLPNGDDFVGWGQAGEVSEFSATGQLTFDMHFTTPTNTYRAFRYAWNAQPETQPALVASASDSGTTEIYASWNGATGVAGWRVLAGTSASALSIVGIYPAQGFETAIAAPTTAPYIRVQALSASGALLRSSVVVTR